MDNFFGLKNILDSVSYKTGFIVGIQKPSPSYNSFTNIEQYELLTIYKNDFYNAHFFKKKLTNIINISLLLDFLLQNKSINIDTKTKNIKQIIFLESALEIFMKTSLIENNIFVYIYVYNAFLFNGKLTDFFVKIPMYKFIKMLK